VCFLVDPPNSSRRQRPFPPVGPSARLRHREAQTAYFAEWELLRISSRLPEGVGIGGCLVPGLVSSPPLLPSEEMAPPNGDIETHLSPSPPPRGPARGPRAVSPSVPPLPQLGPLCRGPRRRRLLPRARASQGIPLFYSTGGTAQATVWGQGPGVGVVWVHREFQLGFFKAKKRTRKQLEFVCVGGKVIGMFRWGLFPPFRLSFALLELVFSQKKSKWRQALGELVSLPEATVTICRPSEVRDV